MIKRLKYREIDFEKYSQCIENSVQRNWYAQKEILDELCENWELLSYKNYTYVLPVPIREIMGVSFVVMPLFLQQLGVFGNDDDKSVNENFLEFLIENYNVYNYNFNHINQFKTNLVKRKNYIISIQDYSNIRRKYSKGRKAILKNLDQLLINEYIFNEHIKCFIIKNFKGLKNEKQILDFTKFIKENNNQFVLKGITYNNQLISLAILVLKAEEIGLIALINDDRFNNKNAASFLIDDILKTEISQRSLDFMGGNIRGIEIFFKSFGAELSTYSIISNSKIELFKNLFRFKFEKYS